jgi:hypothetical protein
MTVGIKEVTQADETRQQKKHILHIIPIDSSATKEVPLDADVDELWKCSVDVTVMDLAA